MTSHLKTVDGKASNESTAPLPLLADELELVAGGGLIDGLIILSYILAHYK